MAYDTIIRNGRWFDGTGAPSAVRNIGISAGHVTAVSTEELDEAHTVATGSCSISTVRVDAEEAGDVFGRVEAIARQHVIKWIGAHKTWSSKQGLHCSDR